jgi:hypothetical protein
VSLEDVRGPALIAPTFDRKPGQVDLCARCGAHERFHTWRCERCARRLEPSGDRAHLPVKLCAGCPGAGATLYCPPRPAAPAPPHRKCLGCKALGAACVLHRKATPGPKKAR